MLGTTADTLAVATLCDGCYPVAHLLKAVLQGGASRVELRLHCCGKQLNACRASNRAPSAAAFAATGCHLLGAGAHLCSAAALWADMGWQAAAVPGASAGGFCRQPWGASCRDALQNGQCAGLVESHSHSNEAVQLLKTWSLSQPSEDGCPRWRRLPSLEAADHMCMQRHAQCIAELLVHQQTRCLALFVVSCTGPAPALIQKSYPPKTSSCPMPCFSS